jgi:penicillin-binding protein 1A
MNKVYSDSTLNVSKEDFEKPEQPLSIEIDCDAYLKKGSGFDDSNNDHNFE